jgi:5-methylthioadenosine/S-adenosylhomocysteine deaminase
MPELRDCVVLHGPELTPHRCPRFAWLGDTITAIEPGPVVNALDLGALVIMPGLYNSHTHLGDSALPDGATGLSLEEAFFRPDGYKYRELARLEPEAHLPHLIETQRYMARAGTVCHLDFREQGAAGAQLLRAASAATGVESIILSQFENSPFSAELLTENMAPLPEAARDELVALLAVADGFSESTMNDLTDAGWSEVRAATGAAGKWRAIHCLENASYRGVSLQRTGRGDLIRALELFDPHLVVHLTVADDDEIALMARAGKTAVLNPRANAGLGLPLPPMLRLWNAGVNLLLGTDNVMLNAPSLWAEMDFTSRVARSQSGDSRVPAPKDVLAMTTRNIRAVLGGDHYGYLEKGLPATFVVLDFRAAHLRHTRHLIASIVGRLSPADVVATYRTGRPLWQTDGFAP